MKPKITVVGEIILTVKFPAAELMEALENLYVACNYLDIVPIFRHYYLLLL